MVDDANPTTMFERMYVAAAEGRDGVPWDRGGPHPLPEEWAAGLVGTGRQALVVGSGPGTDAEHVAARGFDVVAFDVSPTAIDTARRQFPETVVDYAGALEPVQIECVSAPDEPARWRAEFRRA